MTLHQLHCIATRSAFVVDSLTPWNEQATAVTEAERTKMAMQEELAKKRTVDRQSEADLKQAVLNAEKGACHAATASARIASSHHVTARSTVLPYVLCMC